MGTGGASSNRRLEYLVPVDGRSLFADRLDEGLDVPRGKRLCGIVSVGVELGVELEVPGRC